MPRDNPIATAEALARKPLDSEIDVYGLTHPGKVRKQNQDNFIVATLHKRVDVKFSSLLYESDASSSADERLAFVAMVADGVGGTEHGEEASRLAVATVTQYVTRTMRCYYGADTKEESLRDALQEAARQCHESVRAYAEAADTRSMATTLTLFLGVWPWIYLLQVGDSRCYLLREGVLTQLTRDQTMAQELMDLGVLRPTDAQHTRLSHVLSSAIGGHSTAPIVTRLPAEWNNVHLLCSDGLTRHVPDERIRETLSSMTSAKQACESLLQDALDGGGLDNITVVIGQAVPRETPPPA
jgi:protein phosphatase